MVYNCSNIVEDIFYRNTEGVQYTEILLAAKFFCDHINNIHAILGANLTELETYFESLCCTDELITSLCQEFPFSHSNLSLDLDCLQVAKTSYNYFDLHTYILMAILLPLGLLGNFLILYAVICYKCLPAQTGYFLCSLAAADLGVILEFVAFFLYHKNDSYVSERVHTYLFPSLDMFFAAVSLLQISMISIERAVAVTWPFKYPSYISTSRAKRFVKSIWLFSTLIMVLGLLRIPIVSEAYATAVFYVAAAILLFLPLTVIIVAYSFVVVSAYQNLRQDRKRLRMLAVLLRKDHHRDNEVQRPKKACWKLSSVRCKEIKLSVNVAMIVLPFLFFWGFFMFAHIYELLTGYRFKGFYNWLIGVLPFVVSTLNPMLYLVLTRSLRKAVKSMICKGMKSKLSRAELSVVTVTSMHNGANSRRTSNANCALNKKQHEVVYRRDIDNDDFLESAEDQLINTATMEDETSTQLYPDE